MGLALPGWEKVGDPPWEPGGWRRRRQLMNFANCQGLQAAESQAPGWICFGTRHLQHLLPTSPGGHGEKGGY